MKHIYIVDEHQSSKQNGVGTYIRQLLKCFESSGHDVNLLSFNSDEKEFKIDAKVNYREYHMPLCGTDNFLKLGALSLPLLRMYIEDQESNVFFVNHSPCSSFLTYLKKCFPLSRIIFVIHDQGWCAPLLGDSLLMREIVESKKYLDQKCKSWKFIKQYCADERKMYQKADEVVALANTTARLLCSDYKVPKEKIHIIPNGKIKPISPFTAEEKSRIRKRLGFNEKERIILYAGRVVESKGIFSLLSAFEQIYLKEPDVQLVIAGKVIKLEECVSLTPYASSHVTYTGLISEDDVATWCKVSDICILPSYTEQSSYFGIEMLANGCFIIATDGNNMDDMFNEDVALIAKTKRGWDSFKIELKEKIEFALNMEECSVSNMRSAAFNRYLEKYTIDIMRQSYLRLIS